MVRRRVRTEPLLLAKCYLLRLILQLPPTDIICFTVTAWQHEFHAGTQTAQYVEETISELEKCESKAFVGGFEYYIVKAGMLRTSEGVKLNDIEYKRWHELASMKDLGNDLFFGLGL